MIAIRHHAHAITDARAFAAEASAQPALLFVIGPTGVGKTELVQQVSLDVSAAGRRRCATLVARDLVAELVEAIRNNTVGHIAVRFGPSDVVVIEDVSDLRDRPASQAELGRLIAGWVAAGARVVCTAGCSLQMLTDFEQRLPRSPVLRVIALPRPTRSEMRAALRSLATTASIRIDKQSLTELAAWCNGDVRRAVGAIRQLEFEAAYAR
jgi:chromosomal replication initiation ATPase DnaA